MKIEVGKFYKTRDGRKVEIYSIDNDGDYPVHARMFNHDGNQVFSYSSNGQYDVSFPWQETHDLISEWVEPLDFDWDCLPKWADRYIVMDRYKDWMCVESKPLIRYENSNAWTARAHSNYNIIPKNFYPKNFTGDWKDSLFKNPKYKD